MDLIRPARPDKIPWDEPCREPVYIIDKEPDRFFNMEALPISNMTAGHVMTGGLPLPERYRAVQGSLTDIRGRMVHPVYDLREGPKVDDLCEVIGSTSRAYYLRDPDSKRIFRLDRSRVKLINYAYEVKE